ncbi:MAG: YgiT-type zinc finger domain-containing protein [Thermoanaerobaculia bacterium]
MTITGELTRCFHCGGTDLGEQDVEELISTDRYVVRCRVSATVCHRCGERYFSPQTVRDFEAIRARIDIGDLRGLREAGKLLEPAA